MIGIAPTALAAAFPTERSRETGGSLGSVGMLRKAESGLAGFRLSAPRLYVTVRPLAVVTVAVVHQAAAPTVRLVDVYWVSRSSTRSV